MEYKQSIWDAVKRDHGNAHLSTLRVLANLASLTDADGGYHNILMSDAQAKIFHAVRQVCATSIGDMTFPVDKYGYVSVLDGRCLPTALSKQAVFIDPSTHEDEALKYADALRGRMYNMVSSRVESDRVVRKEFLHARTPQCVTYEGLAHLRVLFMIEGSAYVYRTWFKAWLTFMGNYDRSQTFIDATGHENALVAAIRSRYLTGSNDDTKDKIRSDHAIITSAFNRVISGGIDVANESAFSAEEAAAIDAMLNLRFLFALFRTCACRTDSMYARIIPVSTEDCGVETESAQKYFAGRKEFAELQAKYPIIIGLTALDKNGNHTLKEAEVRPKHSANTFVVAAQRPLTMYRKLTVISDDNGQPVLRLRGTTDPSTQLGDVDDTPTLPIVSLGDWNFLRMTSAALVIPKKTQLHAYNADLCYTQLTAAVFTGLNVFRSVYTTGISDCATLAKIRELWVDDPSCLFRVVKGSMDPVKAAYSLVSANDKKTFFSIVNPAFTSATAVHTIFTIVYGLRCFGVDNYVKDIRNANDVRSNVIDWASDHGSFVNAILKTDGSDALPTLEQYAEAGCLKHKGLDTILADMKTFFTANYDNNYVPIMAMKWLCVTDSDLPEDYESYATLSLPFANGGVYVFRLKRVAEKRLLVTMFSFVPYNKEVL